MGCEKIHRDIKAGNILLNEKGEGKLADFGVSGQLSDTMAKRQTVIGTPFWMAPEVIQEVGYDVRADIWSLGITAIELAEGKPPYSNIHPMRAIFMIPSRPPPKFSEPDNWSKDFNDFIAQCLTKNPEQRPQAADLLKSSFIVKAKTSAVLKPLIDESTELINKLGREEAMGFESEEEEEEESGSGSVKRRDSSSASTVQISTTSGYSTMVVQEDASGTMKVGGNTNEPGYVPPFLQQFQKDKESVQLNPKYANVSTDDLKKQLNEMNGKLEKELEAIKAKYAKQKKDLETALKSKKK